MRPVLVCFVLLLSLAACSGPPEGQSQKQPGNARNHAAAPGAVAARSRPVGPDAEAIAANNHGVGLMGKFDYPAAYDVFNRLAQRYPDWLEVQVNRAIATLNRQQEGDEAAALGMVDQVLAKETGNLRANYVAGLLRLYLASPQQAVTHFQRVAEADPEDAYAAYYLGQCLAQLSKYEDALAQYRRALTLDPYLRSAYYGAFQTLQRLHKTAAARALIGDYQRLANNPRARLAEFRYTRMGPKADALAVDLPAPVPVPRPGGEVFAGAAGLPIDGGAALHWAKHQAADRSASITAVDLQGDGYLDLFVAGALAGAPGPNLVLEGGADGSFKVARGLPLSAVDHVSAALWGDFDNDGLVDVYLCRRGANQLWRQASKGKWEDVTAKAGVAGGDHETLGGAVLDADHDGDLDIYVINADGPGELYNNNLDGTFRPLAASQGIGGSAKGARQVLPVDLDGDLDLDLVLFNAAAPNDVYLNDRMWAYREASGYDALRKASVLAAVAGDADADGMPEIYTLSRDGTVRRWGAGAGGTWQAQNLPELAGPLPEDGGARLALLDVDGDGTPELLRATADGWLAGRLGAGDRQVLYRAQADLAGWAPVLLQPGKGPAVIGLQAAGGLRHWAPGPGRYPFLGLTLTGMEDSGASMRSNASGLGARVAVRVDSRWSIASSLPQSSGPGQSLQGVAVGLGGAPKADFVAIDWSDGVYQSELDLRAGESHRISETQRQLSSCPVLFAWDGRHFAFVSDLLGVGGLGYALGPGEYAPSRPWENFLLPRDLAQPRGGRYELKISEPMEEVAYLDAASLRVYDLPPGWDLVLDERMGTGDPEPTGEPWLYRAELLPRSARNERGEDVTAAVLRADGRAAPPGALDRRFIGRLAGEHVLTLELPSALDAHAGKPVLVMDGWVEYPYSQTMVAAWQAGAAYHSPALEARGADGRWHTLLREFGYPAGMPRRMSVPLAGLPAGTRALRLRTNMEIYWDRISVVYAEPAPEVRVAQLPLTAARLAKTGFALRTTGPQRRPHYDYDRRSPFWDSRYLSGWYTRLGSVQALVAKVDDAVAIVGPGDEVQLSYTAPVGPLPRGWIRRLVLEARGWAKDRDLYTKDGETVGPLPTSGRGGARREELHRRYNTRFQAGT